MALNMESRRVPNAYRFIGDGFFLNIAYMTGFVTHPNKDAGTFKLQQVNNEELALTIHVPKGDRVPAANRCITAKCHVFGVVREDGAIVAELRAIDISDANKLAVPTYIAWNGLGGTTGKSTTRPIGSKPSDTAVQPFAENGELKPEIASTLATDTVAAKRDEDEGDGFEAVMKILTATRGRLDSKLGENANVVMFAGVVERASIVKRTEFTKEYVALLVRQHADPSKAIPVRLHPDANIPLDIHLKELKPGYPVKVVGRAQEKLIKDPTGEHIIDRQTYIRCHQLSTPTVGREMLFPSGVPAWWHAMCVNETARVNERRRKLTESVTPKAQPSGETTGGLDNLDL